jgi:predicted Zn-dependent protease
LSPSLSQKLEELNQSYTEQLKQKRAVTEISLKPGKLDIIYTVKLGDTISTIAEASCIGGLVRRIGC